MDPSTSPRSITADLVPAAQIIGGVSPLDLSPEGQRLVLKQALTAVWARLDLLGECRPLAEIAEGATHGKAVPIYPDDMRGASRGLLLTKFRDTWKHLGNGRTDTTCKALYVLGGRHDCPLVMLTCVWTSIRADAPTPSCRFDLLSEQEVRELLLTYPTLLWRVLQSLKKVWDDDLTKREERLRRMRAAYHSLAGIVDRVSQPRQISMVLVGEGGEYRWLPRPEAERLARENPNVQLILYCNVHGGDELESPTSWAGREIEWPPSLQPKTVTPKD